jgi:hypothetical protein
VLDNLDEVERLQVQPHLRRDHAGDVEEILHEARLRPRVAQDRDERLACRGRTERILDEQRCPPDDGVSEACGARARGWR